MQYTRCPKCGEIASADTIAESMQCGRCGAVFPTEPTEPIVDEPPPIPWRNLIYPLLGIVVVASACCWGLAAKFEPNVPVTGGGGGVDQELLRELEDYSRRVEAALDRGDEKEAIRLIEEGSLREDFLHWMNLSDRANALRNRKMHAKD